MTVKKIFKIDGDKVQSTEEVLMMLKQEVQSSVDHTAAATNDSLADILNTSGGVDIVWQNADVSERKLGQDFSRIVATIRNHGPGGAKAQDDVHLFLN